MVLGWIYIKRGIHQIYTIKKVAKTFYFKVLATFFYIPSIMGVTNITVRAFSHHSFQSPHHGEIFAT
jgi:hypothetical protein